MKIVDKLLQTGQWNDVAKHQYGSAGVGDRNPPKPETRNRKPETGNPKPETRNRNPSRGRTVIRSYGHTIVSQNDARPACRI